MLDIAREFVQGAELALEKELYRVAAGNACYSMFWSAQSALRHVGVVRGEWSHGGLLQVFGLEVIKRRSLTPSRLGDWLGDAHKLRRDAHYRENGVGAKETRRVVQHAREFALLIEEVTEK